MWMAECLPIQCTNNEVQKLSPHCMISLAPSALRWRSCHCRPTPPDGGDRPQRTGWVLLHGAGGASQASLDECIEAGVAAPKRSTQNLHKLKGNKMTFAKTIFKPSNANMFKLFVKVMQKGFTVYRRRTKVVTIMPAMLKFINTSTPGLRRSAHETVLSDELWACAPFLGRGFGFGTRMGLSSSSSFGGSFLMGFPTVNNRPSIKSRSLRNAKLPETQAGLQRRENGWRPGRFLDGSRMWVFGSVHPLNSQDSCVFPPSIAVCSIKNIIRASSPNISTLRLSNPTCHASATIVANKVSWRYSWRGILRSMYFFINVPSSLSGVYPNSLRAFCRQIVATAGRSVMAFRKASRARHPLMLPLLLLPPSLPDDRAPSTGSEFRGINFLRSIWFCCNCNASICWRGSWLCDTRLAKVTSGTSSSVASRSCPNSALSCTIARGCCTDLRVSTLLTRGGGAPASCWSRDHCWSSNCEPWPVPNRGGARTGCAACTLGAGEAPSVEGPGFNLASSSPIRVKSCWT